MLNIRRNKTHKVKQKNRNYIEIMKEPKNIYESILPLHLIGKALALNPIKFNSNAQKFEICKHSFVFCLIFGFITTFFISYLVEHAKLNDRDAGNNTISQASFWFDLYAGIFIQLTGILLSCINAQITSKLLTQMIHIDQYINKLGYEVSHKGTFYLSLGGFIFVLIEFFITAIPDYVFFSTPSQTKLFLVISYITIITNGVIKLQFVVFIYLVYTRFKSVNVILKEMHKSIASNNITVNVLNLPEHFDKVKDNTDARRINQVHCIHNKLSELCRYINWLYGFQILSIIGSAFNITINEFYYCYNISKITENNKVLDIYFSIQWGVLQQIEIFIIVIFCSNTSNEARKVIYIIHVLQYASGNEDFCISLKLFSLHELHKKVKFTACGLFPMDCTTLLMIYAAITAYLVIMIQYDMAKSSNSIIST